MNDIKLTLSQDPKLRAPSVEEEARWLEEAGTLWYTLPSKPRYASAGCWVYFVRGGQLVARAKASEFARIPAEQAVYSYTGVRTDKDAWNVSVVPPMQLASRPIPHKGFQGFRYVMAEERRDFESAFEG